MKPDAHSVFSRVLNEAIGALPEQTPVAREEVYRKVRLFLVTSRHAHMGRQLEVAIAELEAKFVDSEPAAGPRDRRLLWRKMATPRSDFPDK